MNDKFHDALTSKFLELARFKVVIVNKFQKSRRICKPNLQFWMPLKHGASKTDPSNKSFSSLVDIVLSFINILVMLKMVNTSFIESSLDKWRHYFSFWRAMHQIPSLLTHEPFAFKFTFIGHDGTEFGKTSGRSNHIARCRLSFQILKIVPDFEEFQGMDSFDFPFLLFD